MLSLGQKLHERKRVLFTNLINRELTYRLPEELLSGFSNQLNPAIGQEQLKFFELLFPTSFDF